MANNIELIEKEIGSVIEVEENIPIWKMPQTMGRDFKLIFEYLAFQECSCSDAPYAHYLNIDWKKEMSKGALANFASMLTKKWPFQVGVPTLKALPGESRLRPQTIGKKKYVQIIHFGPYKKVCDTYKKMYAWICQEGLTPKGEAIEFYLNDPREVPKNELQTRILIPVE